MNLSCVGAISDSESFSLDIDSKKGSYSIVYSMLLCISEVVLLCMIMYIMMVVKEMLKLKKYIRM